MRAPKIGTMAWIVGFVTAVVLIATLMHTNDLLEASNTQSSQADKDADIDRLRAEYERVLLGCQTAGAIASDDELLRDLCDNVLPMIRIDLKEAEAHA